MGILSDIQEALAEAFDDDLSDVVVSFTLTKKSDGTYDPVSDTKTSSETSYESRGVFVSFGSAEIDGTNIKSEDEKLIVNGSDLSVNANIDDVVKTSNGQSYIVVNSTPVMGGGSAAIVYIIQIRKSVKNSG